MWPDSPFAESRGSFRYAVQPPSVDPDASPTITVTISCAWLPFIRGALKQLLLQSTWKDDITPLLLSQQRAFNLIDLFQECSSPGFAIACPYDFRSASVSDWNISSTWGDLTPPPLGHFTPFIGGIPDAKSEPGGNQTWTAVVVERTFSTAFQIEDVAFDYDLFRGGNYLGNFDANQVLAVQLLNGGTFVAQHGVLGSAAADGSGSHFVTNFAGATADTVKLLLVCGVDGPGFVGGSGSGRIYAVGVDGTSSTPVDCTP